MFLYAKLVLKHLFDLPSIAKLKEELQPGVFPESLDEALVNHSFHSNIVSLRWDHRYVI